MRSPKINRPIGSIVCQVAVQPQAIQVDPNLRHLPSLVAFKRIDNLTVDATFVGERSSPGLLQDISNRLRKNGVCRGAKPLAGGLGVSPRYNFFPLPGQEGG
jgi:hypothetical protein